MYFKTTRPVDKHKSAFRRWASAAAIVTAVSSLSSPAQAQALRFSDTTPGGILAIGNVIDTQTDYPETVVASALWHFEPTLQAALAKIVEGSFEADNYGLYSFMKEGGCSLAPLGTFEGKVPEEAMKMVDEKRKAIKSGEFTVEINDEEPKSS